MSRFFEIVPQEVRYWDEDFPLMPVRSTKKSAGYDFKTPTTFIMEPGDTVFIWTDIRAIMEEDEVLMIYPRSSLGIKHGIKLSNDTAIIDADYAENEKTSGNIGISLKNEGNERIFFNRGDKIAQGIFTKYLISDNCNSDEERQGGIGSTN